MGRCLKRYRAILAAVTIGVALWARYTAKSAEQIARETKESITHALGAVDAQRVVADARRLTDLVRDNKHAVAIEVIPRIQMVLADLEHRVVGLPSRFAQLRQHLDDEVDDIHTRLDNLVGTEDTVAAEEILDRLRGVSKGLIKLASAFSA